MPSMLGPWGLLPVVAPLFAFVAARLGALAFAREPARATTSDRAVAGVVLAFALAIGGVRALSVFDAVVPSALFALLLATAAALALLDRRGRLAWPATPFADVRDPGVVATLLVLAVLAAALALAVVSALWLPVWQWDSLGYHLPFVHFTLAARSLAGVPPDLAYVGSYPHDAELFFVALRACLPDDRLVDLGQVPFGLGGAIVTAALARQAGAGRGIARVAGASWPLLPAVFLQLPTDYVDVATATFLLAAVYFVLAPPSSAGVALGGLAMGLVAGSKPSGPLPAAVLLVILLARALRADLRPAAALAVALAAAFGAETYAQNLLRHANPVWPLRLDLGPLHLAGESTLAELLAAGAFAPRLTGPLPSRFVRSLLAITAVPAYDMRAGGFGLTTLLALPFAARGLVRRRSAVAWLALASTLMSPDPAIARYVLAFPALVLAAAAAEASRLGARGRMAVGLVAATLGALQVAYAAPGLTGEGPPLAAYAAMTDAERALAVGADGRPLGMAEARSRVGPGEALAFDAGMDLADLAWDERQSYRVMFLPKTLADEALGRALDLGRVRVIVVGRETPAGRWADAHPGEFQRLDVKATCRDLACAVYVRR